jgi:hypothetical protein
MARSLGCHFGASACHPAPVSCLKSCSDPHGILLDVPLLLGVVDRHAAEETAVVCLQR